MTTTINAARRYSKSRNERMLERDLDGRIYNYPGDPLWRKAGEKPSLDLRFAENKSLVDATTGANLVTFSRASGGTYVDSQGVIRNAVTNLLIWSEDPSQWPTPLQAGATLTPNTAIAPNGTLTADTLTLSANSFYYGRPSYTQTGSYIVSIFIRADSPQTIGLRIANSSGSESAFTTCSVTTNWQRFSAAINFTSNPNVVNVGLETRALGGGTGSAATVYIWGAQLEQSSTVGEYIPTGATINSAPRFDHNPTTGESLGLLVEEQRQNLLLNSGTLSTQNVTVTAVAHTLSFTGTGTITLSGTSTAGPLVGTGTGEANRVSLTFTPTAGTLTLTVSGTVTNAQLEIGAFRTSYIPTAGTAATRSADVASISGSNFSSWYNQSQGTFYGDAFRQFAVPASDFPILADSRVGTDRIQLGYLTEGLASAYVQVGGVTQAEMYPGSGNARNRKVAFAASQNNYAATCNGGAVLTDTSGTMPTAMVSLGIGSHTQNAQYLNGTIRRLTYWPQRLGNEVLQRITQ